MPPLRQGGWIVVVSLSTSRCANVSLTLTCALCHAAGKSAGALKTENAPNGPLIRPPHGWDEAFVALDMVITCRVASYHGALFSRVLTSNYLSISNRRPLRSDTAFDDKFLRASGALNYSYLAVYVVCVQTGRWYRYGHTCILPC